MGFYIRKGFNFGPLRLNLSRSGLGASFGVKGARIGLGPRGSYVHMGRGGLYYRQSLTMPATPRSQPPVPSALPQTSENLKVVTSGAASGMVDSSAGDLLQELNRVKKRFDRFPLVLIFGAALFAFLLLEGVQWWELTGALVATGSLAIYARHADVTNGTAILNYSLEDEAGQRFSHLQEAFKHFSGCSCVWHIEETGHTDDWKRHAGATALFKRNATSPTLSKPSKVQCNIEVPTLKGGSNALYFFPDRLLVYDSSGVGVVPYDQLEVEAGEARFVEDGTVPGDATKIGTTWKYVSKRGGPDRRFNNNRQLPILQYGLLALTSKSGLKEIFQCSASKVPAQVASALADLGNRPKLVPSGSSGRA